MRGNLIESVMGAVVLVVAALFLFFAFNTSQLRAVPGYELVADFERVDENERVRVTIPVKLKNTPKAAVVWR